MMYKVQLSPKAKKFYQDAHRSLAKKLARCFERLEQAPRSYPNIKSLKGNLAGYYRYRVGEYRVIYYIEDEEKIVVVIVIAHRSDSY